MVRKYIILAVTAALLSPCLLTFADDDLQGQLDDVQNRMAEQSEKKAQAQMVIDNVSDKLYEIQKSLEAAQSSTRTGRACRSGRKSLPSASAISICTAS